MNYGTRSDEWHAPADPGLRIRGHQELFPTGSWTITPAAILLLAHHNVDPAGILWRHRAGDWGDVDLDQAMANNDAVLFGGSIVSMHEIGSERVFIETAEGGTITRVFTSDD